jgi:hypothetical protein
MRSSPFQPEPIEVITADGLPARVLFRRKLQRVRGILNLWRIDDGWWRTPAARLYYSLELEGGGRITIFHDLIHDTWYRQNWTGS